MKANHVVDVTTGNHTSTLTVVQLPVPTGKSKDEKEAIVALIPFWYVHPNRANTVIKIATHIVGDSKVTVPFLTNLQVVSKGEPITMSIDID